MTLRAPAKVNLTLEILGRRDDGYHALRSVMIPVGLADEIAVEPAARFAFTCSAGALTHDNLVVRALVASGIPAPPFALHLTKHIPVGAGLGGGSSDAAAVLLAALSGAFGTIDDRDWPAIARRLGSDVPFFLAEGGALVEGTGERVSVAGSLPDWWTVLLAPDVHVDTADAYRRLAAERAARPVELRARAGSPSLTVLAALQRADYDVAIAHAINDFEPLIAAAYPAVRTALAALRAADAPHAMLSGSGAATFSLCRDERRARELAERIDMPAGARVFVAPLLCRHDALHASAP